MRAMKWNKLYKYPIQHPKSLVEGNRHYDVSNEILPSVTTILQATQSDDKKASLAKLEAERLATMRQRKYEMKLRRRGTAMHEFLEMHLRGDKLLDLSDEGLAARNMARIIIEQGLKGMPKKFGDLK